MATLGGNDMGYIRTEENGKVSNLFIQPLPASDSSDAIVLDFFGVTRTINITGVKTGVTATLQSFITTFEALQDGSQTSVTFVSSIHPNNKTVYVNSFRWNYSSVNPNILNYTIELIEGS